MTTTHGIVGHHNPGSIAAPGRRDLPTRARPPHNVRCRVCYSCQYDVPFVISPWVVVGVTAGSADGCVGLGVPPQLLVCWCGFHTFAVAYLHTHTPTTTPHCLCLGGHDPAWQLLALHMVTAPPPVSLIVQRWHHTWRIVHANCGLPTFLLYYWVLGAPWNHSLFAVLGWWAGVQRCRPMEPLPPRLSHTRVVCGARRVRHALPLRTRLTSACRAPLLPVLPPIRSCLCCSFDTCRAAPRHTSCPAYLWHHYTFIAVPFLFNNVCTRVPTSPCCPTHSICCRGLCCLTPACRTCLLPSPHRTIMHGRQPL